MKSVLVFFLLALAAVSAAASPVDASLVDSYLERYFAFYPARATAAGHHDLDGMLEDLAPARRRAWLDFNRKAAAALAARLADPKTDLDERLDDEIVLRQARTEIFDLATLDRPERDPLFWTGLLGDAEVFLLVREDRPREERLGHAADRAVQLPRLAQQAREALAASPPSALSPEICGLAARQVRASAVLYRRSLPLAAAGLPAPLTKRVGTAGAKAAEALDGLAAFLDRLTQKATGSPRLGAQYAERFRLVTGVEEPVDAVLAQAEEDLKAKRAEAAAFGRGVWPSLLPGETPPQDDRELLRRLFTRVAADRAHSTEEFIADFRTLTAQALDFARTHGIITLPDPPTLHIDRSPSYFLGQSVGGVYSAGPYAPDAETLYYLPAPPDNATAAEKDAFFRDFNHHFNVMITGHEMVPGHYVQLKIAAHQLHKVRALFPDNVYVEGWGTFCERLMLDLGWGGPLDRLAHLKKQMENLARTIVDIRVHTRGMSRGEVIRFVKEEALQDDQFAANMWTRSITTSPQITFYSLGYRQVRSLYDDVRKAQGDAFDLRQFMDGMMALGPVPVARYREKMLPVRVQN